MTHTLDAFDFKTIKINNKSAENNYEWGDLLDELPKKSVKKSNGAPPKKASEPRKSKRIAKNEKVDKKVNVNDHLDVPLNGSKSIADEKTTHVEEVLDVSIDVTLKQETVIEYSNTPIAEPVVAFVDSEVLQVKEYGDAQLSKISSTFCEMIHEPVIENANTTIAEPVVALINSKLIRVKEDGDSQSSKISSTFCEMIQEPVIENANTTIAEPVVALINSKLIRVKEDGDSQPSKLSSKLTEMIDESGDCPKNHTDSTAYKQFFKNEETICDTKQKYAEEYDVKVGEIFKIQHNFQIEEKVEEKSNLYVKKAANDQINLMEVPYLRETDDSKKIIVSDCDSEKIVIPDCDSEKIAVSDNTSTLKNGNTKTINSEIGDSKLIFRRMSSSPFISDAESADNSTEFSEIKQSITFNLKTISPINPDNSHLNGVIKSKAPVGQCPIFAELNNPRGDPVKRFYENTDSEEISVKSVLEHRKTLRDKAKLLTKLSPDNESVFSLRTESSSRMKKSASNPLIRGVNSKKLVLTTPAIMGRIKEDSKKSRDRDHMSDSEDDLVERKRRDRFTRPTSSSISDRAPSRGESSEAGDQPNYRSFNANRSNYGPTPNQMRPMGYTQPGPPVDFRMGPNPYQKNGYYQSYDNCMGSGRYSAQIHGRYTPNQSLSYQNYMIHPNYYPNYGPPLQQHHYRPRSSFEPSTRKTADYGDMRTQRRAKDPSYDYSFCESNQSDAAYIPPKRGGNFPPQVNDAPEDIPDEEAYENDDEDGESENELAQYNQRMYIPENFVLNSILSYNLGIIGMDVNLAYEIIRESRPPVDFPRMAPQAQAIYLHYYSVFRNFLDIADFLATFNKKYSIYEASGRNEKDILMLICKSTEEQFRKQVEEEHKRKLEEAQRLLFETVASPDYGNRESADDDVDSLLSYHVEPYFFTGPHRFQNFTSAGITIFYDPKECDKKIQLSYNKDWYLDSEERKILEYVKAQPGPLNVATVAFHEVELFVKEQIMRIRESQLYKRDPKSRDANDCILVWRLLQLLVKQDGIVKPQQFAELLLEDGLTSLHGDNEEDDYSDSEQLKAPIDLSKKEFAEFTLLLANGHTKKAIKYAMEKNAIQLALSICLKFIPEDTHQIKEILKKSLTQCLPSRHPVEGMVNILENGVVPSLNSTDEKCFDWRIYASYVFSNLGKTTTVSSIYNMGLEFSKNEYHAAADFCFLATHCFHSSYNPFVAPAAQANENARYRKHITLIHASVPDDPPTNAITRFGWSVIDFKATEIYEYALQLASKGQSPQNVLTMSKDFQVCRMQYSLMISQFGGLAKPAFDYCFSIASNVWTQTQIYDIQNLEKLCDLADSLKFWGGSDENTSSWIPILEKACQERRGIFVQQAPPPPQQLSPSQTFSNPTSQETIAHPQNELIEYVKEGIESTTLQKEEIPKFVESRTESHQSNVGTDISLYSAVNEPTSISPVEEPSIYAAPVVEEVLQSQPTEEKVNPKQIPQQNISETNGIDAIPTLSTPISPRKKSRTFSISSENGKNKESGHVQQFEYSKPTQQPEMVPYQGERTETVNQQPNYVPEDYSQQKPPVLQQPKDVLTQQQPNNVLPQNGVEKKPRKIEEKGSGGYLDVLKSKLVKYIPSGNEMKLPDDSNNMIYFDKDLNKWVGTEVEEEVPVAAPPTMMNGAMTGHNNKSDTYNSNSNGSGYQARRQPGRSRYCNPLSDQTAASSLPAPEMNGMLPGGSNMPDMMLNQAGFGFIPTMPPDNMAVPKEILDQMKAIKKATTKLDAAVKAYDEIASSLTEDDQTRQEFDVYDAVNKAQLAVVYSQMISLFNGESESYNTHIGKLIPIAAEIGGDQTQDVPKELRPTVNKRAFGNILKNELVDIEALQKNTANNVEEEDDEMDVDEPQNLGN
uniref:Sec16_C domain-containing protein n=1 Tax=Rhabditophanes sp. KR3021 TaxID=114890 RepID=A0AC35TIS7_9BILA